MEKKDVAIRHKGRRFKRAPVVSNGPVVALNPSQPSNPSFSQLLPTKPLNRTGTTEGTTAADETTQPPSGTIFKTSVVLPPSEPPFPSSRGRPPCSKGNSRPSSRSSTHGLVMGISSIGTIPGPQAGFHRLQPLPAIGTSSRRVEDCGDSAVDLCSNGTSSLETKSLSSLSGHNCNSTNYYKSLDLKARKSSLDGHLFHEKLSNISNSSLPPEPSADDSNCVTLAIKLPDGTRFEKQFYHTDLIADIIDAAQHHSPEPLPDCELFTNDVPKKRLTDYSLTLQEAGLSVRTMLILSEL